MSKYPKDPKEIFTEFIGDYRGLFKDDLVSIILYGSAAGRHYMPGKSDINFMIVLTEQGIEGLESVFKTVEKWRRRKVAVPLFLTPPYIETSTDVFPIEYLGFQRRHVLVYGKDLLKDLAFEPEWVRLQCEREIKGKLLLLRSGFIETAGKGRAMKDLVDHSLGAFLVIFEALLFLKETEPPDDRRALIRAAAQSFDLNGGLFEKLLDIKEEKVKAGEGDLKTLLQDYLKEIRQLSLKVDKLGG